MEGTLIGIFLAIIGIAVTLFIFYLIIKAAVAAGIKDAMWNLEVGMRNAVKNGVQEALAEMEKNKTEEKNG